MDVTANFLYKRCWAFQTVILANLFNLERKDLTAYESETEKGGAFEVMSQKHGFAARGYYTGAKSLLRICDSAKFLNTAGVACLL